MSHLVDVKPICTFRADPSLNSCFLINLNLIIRCVDKAVLNGGRASLFIRKQEEGFSARSTSVYACASIAVLHLVAALSAFSLAVGLRFPVEAR